MEMVPLALGVLLVSSWLEIWILVALGLVQISLEIRLLGLVGLGAPLYAPSCYLHHYLQES